MAPRQSSNKKQRKTEDHHREELKMMRTTSISKVFNYDFSVDDFSLEEREVADALLLLQILEPHQYPFISTKSPSRNPLPLPPPWGIRKRRSAINVSPSPSPSPPREPIPVVQPSLLPCCSKEDERIVEQKRTSSSTSPNTPLSFSPSGSGSDTPSNMEGKEQEQIRLNTLTQLTIQTRSLKTEIQKVRHRRNKLIELKRIFKTMLVQALSNRQVNSSIGVSYRREEEKRNTMMVLDQQQPSIMSDSRHHLENNV